MISVLMSTISRISLTSARIFLEDPGEFQGRDIDISTGSTGHLFGPVVRCHHLRLPDAWHGIRDRFFKSGRERFGNIPFILFPAGVVEEVVIDAINNGADFYVQKGGDPQAQFADLAHIDTGRLSRCGRYRRLHCRAGAALS